MNILVLFVVRTIVSVINTFQKLFQCILIVLCVLSTSVSFVNAFTFYSLGFLSSRVLEKLTNYFLKSYESLDVVHILK